MYIKNMICIVTTVVTVAVPMEERNISPLSTLLYEASPYNFIFEKEVCLG